MNRKTFRVSKAGSFKNLRLVEESLSDPKENEVQVEVRAVGLNFADIFAIKGLYSATPKGSFVPGLEFAGIIRKCGKGVEEFTSGMSVMGVTRFGGYASHLNIDHQYVVPLPEGWSFEEGAAFPVQALTAYYALLPLGNLQKGQTVLIHSAAGGVGIMANRIAKKYGAYTLGTVGNKSKVKTLIKEGYNKAIVRDKDFADALKQALGQRSLHLALECIGGKVFRQTYDALAPTGRLITYGSAVFADRGQRPNWFKIIWNYLTRPMVDPMKLVTENKSVMGFNLIWLYEETQLLKDLFTHLNALNIEKPMVGHVFEFEEMKEALQLFQSGSTTGKVIVKFY